jgi:hypothetical protein
VMQMDQSQLFNQSSDVQCGDTTPQQLLSTQ